MALREREVNIIPIDENTEDKILKVFEEYTNYTSELLKPNYNYVWFEISIHSNHKDITFIRKYTNYYNEREKILLEHQFESERERLKIWFNTLKVQIRFRDLKVDSIRIETFGNGFSFKAGIKEEFIRVENLGNLINYLKKNPDKMYFDVDDKFQYEDENKNIQIINADKLKEIMFMLMNIKEK